MQKDLKDVLSPKKNIIIGDNSYIIKSISLIDLADFQEWCLTQKKKEVISIYKLSGQEVSIKEVMDISADQTYYDSQMNTLKGVIYLLHKVIHRYNETDITEDEIGVNLKADQFEEITSILFSDFFKEKIKKNGQLKNVITKTKKK